MKKRLRRNKRKKQRNIIILSTILLSFTLITAYSAFSTSLTLTAKGNIVEKSRVIRSWTQTSNEDFHSTFYRENIVTVSFLNTAEIPNNATKSWDVSADKRRGVMAYVTESQTETGKYDLFIGAKDGVIANKDSRYLFYAFTNLKKIEFNNNYDTSNVTNMGAMFAGGNSLTTLDVSSFKTNNVTSMNSMFTAYYWYSNSNNGWGNRTLTEIIGLENFNTSNVTDMKDMFAGQPLTSLNLSNFNTSKVTTMFHMFNECTKLTELNLCSFNTSKVTNMSGMFNITSSMTKIKVGPNWTTTNADTTNMFGGSGVSSVTTGEC